jgi:hypothetical protein
MNPKLHPILHGKLRTVLRLSMQVCSGLDSNGQAVSITYNYDPMGRRISSTLNNQTTCMTWGQTNY